MIERWTTTVLRRANDLSLALPLGAGIALVCANTENDSYEQFAHALHFAVNDVGMVFFFGLAAKEVLETTASGGASTRGGGRPSRWWRQPAGCSAPLY